MTWFAPSALMTTGLGQIATPESESPQLKVTVTLLLFHPLALGTGS
jgi:hypothetical protein